MSFRVGGLAKVKKRNTFHKLLNAEQTQRAAASQSWKM